MKFNKKNWKLNKYSEQKGAFYHDNDKHIHTTMTWISEQENLNGRFYHTLHEKQIKQTINNFIKSLVKWTRKDRRIKFLYPDNIL